MPSNNNENKDYNDDGTEMVRQEAENQLKQMKQESEEKSKTIAKLQQQLEQQSDYELLKREVQ